MDIKNMYKEKAKVRISPESKFLKYSGELSTIKEVNTHTESGILEVSYKLDLPADPIHGAYYCHSELELLTED